MNIANHLERLSYDAAGIDSEPEMWDSAVESRAAGLEIHQFAEVEGCLPKSATMDFTAPEEVLATAPEALSFGTSYAHSTVGELKTKLQDALRRAEYHAQRANEMTAANTSSGFRYPQVSISDHKWKAKMARQEAKEIRRELQRRG